MRSPLRVQIGELSFGGIPAARGRRIGIAFEAELTRLFVSDTALHRRIADARLTGGSTTGTLNVGAFRMPRTERAERTGQRLARLIAPQLLPGRVGTRR